MSSDEQGLQPLSNTEREVLEEAVSDYEFALAMNDGVSEYLAQRGFTPEIIKQFRLGYVDDPHPGHEAGRGRIVIPYLGRDNQPLTIRFRCAKDHKCKDEKHAKYMSLSHDPARMFNVGAVHRALNEIHITEGELDALTLTQAGLHAVGMPGATSWRYHHRRMLAGFSKVFMWGDPDSSGAELVSKVTKAMRNCRVIKLEEDVNDTFKNHGAEKLLSLLEEAR